MESPYDEAEYKKLHRIIQRIEPNRRYGNIHVEKSLPGNGDDVAEPASEQGSEESSRNTAIEKKLHHPILHAFQLVLFQNQPGYDRHDDPICAIAQHHAEKNGIRKKWVWRR